MGATILDHAVIGENSIIAAGALVLDSTEVEPGSIYAGVPAKRVKSVDPEQTKEKINKIAENYLMYAGWYKEEE
jgi:carbonic anhydrase/acetyltransferase-like protein (isoleucine patch superfamily)